MTIKTLERSLEGKLLGDHLILSLLAKDILAPALHIAALAQLKVLLETKMVIED